VEFKIKWEVGVPLGHPNFPLLLSAI